MADVEDSILKTTKKTLGLSADYTDFDIDVILAINTALSDLNQIGIGPDEGFAIEDDTATWADLLEGNKLLNNVKTYVGLRSRMIFDPPVTSFALEAYQKQIDELAWRINVTREQTEWVDPTLPPV